MSIWIAEGLSYHKEAKTCYVNLLKESKVGLISRSYLEMADLEINELAKDSVLARINSLVCLRKSVQTEEDREALVSAYEASYATEDHLASLEKKILLNMDREYHLTPLEEKSVGDWFVLRNFLVSGIRELTRDAILMPDKDWAKRSRNFESEFYARYGSLLREREKFLFSLSIESRASYLQFLNQFTEK
ncbi:MAG: hypothetical protein SH817_17210 [Leptospira sp.]|nr:hypothetical protein [Leptospira sp.]